MRRKIMSKKLIFGQIHLKCIWHKKNFLLIWKAFQNTEEWRYGAKFHEHCFNISRDIVYSVFTTFQLQ